VFAVVYCVLSPAVCTIWRSVRLWLRQRPPQCCADLLFSLRMVPLISAASVTAVFTVPSFLLLEPRSIDEPFGIVPLVLGACGLGLIAAGVSLAASALLRASRTIATWVGDAQRVNSGGTVPIWRLSRVAPSLTAAGILRPRVLISRAAEFVLTPRELDVALRHEFTHVRRHDNWKKLALRLAAFPGMHDLESAWLQSTEMAADDAAVTSTGEALDLAAALIKLSRIPVAVPVPELTTSLVSDPASAVKARVERLIAWREPQREERSAYSRWVGWCAGLAVVAICFSSYGELLAGVHAATEWLVR